MGAPDGRAGHQDIVRDTQCICPLTRFSALNMARVRRAARKKVAIKRKPEAGSKSSERKLKRARETYEAALALWTKDRETWLSWGEHDLAVSLRQSVLCLM
jgi:hypothetical protein